jgi:hypothetical protein
MRKFLKASLSQRLSHVLPVHHRSAVFRRGSHCLLSSAHGQLRGGEDEDWVTRRPAILTGFSWLSSVPPGKCRDSTLSYATTASFYTHSISSFICHSFIRRSVVRITEKVSLNKLQTNPAIFFQYVGSGSIGLLNSMTSTSISYCPGCCFIFYGHSILCQSLHDVTRKNRPTVEGQIGQIIAVFATYQVSFGL